MVLMNASRQLQNESVEGEVAITIDYLPGKSTAVDVLGGAMNLVQAIDVLDRAILSSLGGELEPVSILNDVQHSSLKLLLARALRKIPDAYLNNLEWKKWVGDLLVQGKHLLLQKLDADATEIQATLKTLEPIYKKAPELIGYSTPKIANVQEALRQVSKARSSFGDQNVMIQTELGDVILQNVQIVASEPESSTVVVTNHNKNLRELFKVRYPDMLGNAQWTVIRFGKNIQVEVLHQKWLDDYHARRIVIQPGDSLDCTFDETVNYDIHSNETERKIKITEVHGMVSPPDQAKLLLT